MAQDSPHMTEISCSVHTFMFSSVLVLRDRKGQISQEYRKIEHKDVVWMRDVWTVCTVRGWHARISHDVES